MTNAIHKICLSEGNQAPVNNTHTVLMYSDVLSLHEVPLLSGVVVHNLSYGLGRYCTGFILAK